MSSSRALQRVVSTALAEDLGEVGDLTGITVLPDREGQAEVVFREPGVISGIDCVRETFAQLDDSVNVTARLSDGDTIAPGSVAIELSGPLPSLLAGERVALNLLGRLSGVATGTRQAVEQVAGTGVQVTDTRKTTPGLRALEKRAVLDGGGVNHRFGLHDAIMVKDNHIALAGGLDAVHERLARRRRHMVAVEVEVDTLAQLTRLLTLERDHPSCHAVLLDNFTPDQVREAVSLVRKHPAPLTVEVSGGITAESIRSYAEAGPDLISVGALTHSARCLDVGLDARTLQGSP
ncbi:carboxylating nicotinate-nucleotide diphosphorylase [Demetria terragena]|uniref:carboxylating nicotinate-nucleotide diphosphorylase n=1 Tax=Demetria terragena TaxID=63959 RepID=UPI000362A6BF|nr:carboxylating nicotinate-nucleotide diphosphorylase [Demetria terragena]